MSEFVLIEFFSQKKFEMEFLLILRKLAGWNRNFFNYSFIWLTKWKGELILAISVECRMSLHVARLCILHNFRHFENVQWRKFCKAFYEKINGPKFIIVSSIKISFLYFFLSFFLQIQTYQFKINVRMVIFTKTLNFSNILSKISN